MKIDDIRRVLILGSGTMGQQIGLLCAFHGYDVVLYDLNQEILSKAMERMRRKAPKMAQAYRFNEDHIEKAIARISLCDTPSQAAQGVDIVSESVPEDPTLKGKIFAQFNELWEKRRFSPPTLRRFCPPNSQRPPGDRISSAPFISTIRP